MSNGNGNGRPRPEFPALRTFMVTRPNLKQVRVVTATVVNPLRADLPPVEIGHTPTHVEEVVEAHRHFTDHAGTLCFEQSVWDTYAKQPVLRMPICFAPGTWFDVIEITKHLEVRPAGQLN